MPSIEGLRVRLLDSLEARCERTGMWTSTAAAAAASWWELLSTLAYIDDREDEYQKLWRDCQAADFGPVGAETMGMWFTSGAPLNGNAETTAWFAELASTLGWLKVTPLSAIDWARLLSAQTDRFPTTDITRQYWVDNFPPPSLLVDRTVYCYAPPDPSGRWAYVDVQHSSYVRPKDRFEGLLRSLRFPGEGHMRDRMIVLPTAQASLPA